jgi:hypothetical protein
MDAVLTWWAMLDPTTQTALLGMLAGAAAWLVQYLWTHVPGLPGLAPDTANIRKWTVAVFLAVLAAAEVAQGDGQRFIVAFIATMGASQTLHTTGKVLTEPDGPDPLQTTVDDDV